MSEEEEILKSLDDLIKYSAYYIYDDKYEKHIKNIKKLKKKIRKDEKHKYLQKGCDSIWTIRKENVGYFT